MNSFYLFIYRIITFFLPETRFFKLKNYLLKISGVSIGKNVRICSSVKFLGNGVIKIGNNTWIGPNCLIISNSPGFILIGNDVDIAPNVSITNGTHEISLIKNKAAGKGIIKNVVISDGVWIGISSTILPGSNILPGCLIAAGSTVINDMPANNICAGVPAKVVKMINKL